MSYLFEVIVASFSFGVVYLAWKAYDDRRFPALALQRFDTSDGSDATKPVVHLRGRPVGLVALIQAMFRVEPSSVLNVMDKFVEFQHKRISGVHRVVIPLDKVTAVHGGFRRPIALLVLPIGFGVLQILAVTFSGAPSDSAAPISAVSGLTLIACGVAAFYFNRKVYFAVDAGDRSAVAIGFQPSVFGGSEFSLIDVLNVVATVRRLILGQTDVGQTNIENGLPEFEAFAADAAAGEWSGENGDSEFGVAAESSGSVSDFSAIADVGNSDSGLDERADVLSPADEERARELFDQAKKRIAESDQTAAIETLQKLVVEYPGSAFAVRARVALRKKGIEPRG